MGVWGRVTRRWERIEPRLPHTEDLGFTARPPVGWVAAGTLVEIARGMIEQLRWQRRGDVPNAGRPFDGFDHDASDHEGLAIDYVGDIGDGFHGSYTLLRAMAADEHRPPGDLLILGGDQVYPVPSDEGYRDRMQGPIGTALPRDLDGRRRVLFSIPGSHDYHDGLDAYRRFLYAVDRDTPRHLGAYEITQQQSYWVVRCPHDWLLVGVDLGASADLDEGQIRYVLDGIAAAVRDDPATRCVLILEKPVWLYGEDHHEAETLCALESRIRELAPIEMVIAGDRHCYIRHEYTEHRGSGQPVVRLTAGNGGAFAHLAQAEPHAPIFNNDRYVARVQYPRLRTVRRLSMAQPVNFVTKNPGFMVWAGLLGLLGLWFVARARDPSVHGWFDLSRAWWDWMPTWWGVGLIASLYVLVLPPEGVFGKHTGRTIWRVVAVASTVAIVSLRAVGVAGHLWERAPTAAGSYLLVLCLAGAILLFPPPDVRGLSRTVWRLVFGVVGGLMFAAFVTTTLVLADWSTAPLSASWWVLLPVGAAIGAPVSSFAVGCLLWVHAQFGVSSTAVYGPASRHHRRAWLRLDVRDDGMRVTVMGIDAIFTRWRRTGPGEPGGPILPDPPEPWTTAGLTTEPRVVDLFHLPGDGSVIDLSEGIPDRQQDTLWKRFRDARHEPDGGRVPA